MPHARPPWVTNTKLQAPHHLPSQLAESTKMIPCNLNRQAHQIVVWRSPPTPRLTFLGCLSARKRSLTWKTVSGGCISKCPNSEPILTRFNSAPFSILPHCLCCSSALPVWLVVFNNHPASQVVLQATPFAELEGCVLQGCKYMRGQSVRAYGLPTHMLIYEHHASCCFLPVCERTN